MTTIYLSSTYEDLKEYRGAVFDALRKSGHHVIAMEDYVATDRRPVEECLRDIGERADIYVGVFAFRYGYIPPAEHIRECERTKRHDDWQGLSITELEFRYAKDEVGLPCLAFVLKEGTPWSPGFVDAYAERHKEHPGERIDRLRQYLLRERMASEFSSPYQLASLVQAAVSKHIQEAGGQRREQATLPPSVTWDLKRDGSPYPGLMHFSRRYAPVFFGREGDVREVLDRLYTGQTRFILVSGDSGVGKSSFLDAGVLPRLEESGLPGGRGCLCVRMVPSHGRHPFDALMRALHAHAEQAGLDPHAVGEELVKNPADLQRRIEHITTKCAGRPALLLFLDQMEELFTGHAPAQADAFLAALYGAVQGETLWVVATIRGDRLHHCHRHPDLLQVLRGPGHYPLGHIEPAVMVDMIRKPAQCAGLEIADRLVWRLARETGSEPGSLPLLAFVLERLFEKREGVTLSEQAYDGFGGIAGAVGHQIKTVEQDIRREIGAAIDELLPRLFQSLLVVDPEGLPTRRRALLDGFTHDLRPLADRLIKARLLSTEGEGAESTVSVAHEKLFEAWPRLAYWIAANKDDLLLLRQVEVAAHQWEAARRPQSHLWPHERLVAVYEAFEQLGLERDELKEPLSGFTRPEAERLLEELEDTAIDHYRRAEIGDRLDRIGDPRRGVGLRDDGIPAIDWVPVPGGAIELEDVKGSFEVEPFQLARYPVTWIQYRAFVEESEGYGNRAWWQDLNREEKPGTQYRRFGNCPADNVSWYDAVAFCRWLTQRLRERGLLADGREVRLPTEGEWQQAATGGSPANTYPWGPEWDPEKEPWRANTSKGGLSRTTAVGMYPQRHFNGGSSGYERQRLGVVPERVRESAPD